MSVCVCERVRCFSWNETTIDTNSVVPVDLNAILARVEFTLAHIYDVLNANPKRAQELRQVRGRICVALTVVCNGIPIAF